MVLNTFLPALIEFINDPIKRYVVLPVKRHLSYAFNYESKVDRLQEVADQLKIKRDRLEKSVADATRNGEEIYDNVTQWLTTSAKAIEEAQQVVHSKQDQVKKRCFVGLCPNLMKRYQLSRIAERNASAVDKVRDEQGLDSISYRPPLKQKVAPSVYIPEALPSRVSILMEVMEALKDPNLSLIGVHGMGGVGKTTLAREVHRQAQVDKLFDVVVMVAVSQTPDLRRIQTEIAEALGMDLKEEGMLIRANRLYDRLKKEKILIILDDIWKQLRLEEVGIPVTDDLKGCKILLTSRRWEVLCAEMGTQKNFRLDFLSEEETWSLFEMKASAAEDQNLPPIAIDVAKRCAGLPLLILKVAADLKNKGSYAWNDKLKQLSEFDDQDIQAKIHSVLEESYNNLSSHQLKSFFLLCGFFGQSNIQIKHLLMYSIGLGLFKRRATIEDARNRVFTLIDGLKAESLLLDGDMEGFVKMHDVVRDTAMSISSRVQHAFFGSSGFGRNEWPDKECTRISLSYNDIHELSEGLECPEAELLFLVTDDFSLKVPALFFERIRKLKVVDFNGIHLESLPSSLAFLTNMQTLCLHRCQLDDVGIIADLRQLQVLSFADSYITELPAQMEQLTQLKFLDLSNCSELEVIPVNVLSRLSSLEVLHMRNSFVDWAGEGTSNEGNARLDELECLPHLSDLEMQVLDARTIPKSLFLNLNGLQNYKIIIGQGWNWKLKNECARTLKLSTNSHLEQGISKLLKESEDLYLAELKGIENVMYNLDGDGFPQLKHLDVVDNGVIQHIVDPKKLSSSPAFPMIESMDLSNLENLENICNGQLPANSFRKLKVLKIKSCGRLTTLFSFSSNDEENIVNVEENIVNVEAEAENGCREVVELSHLRSLHLKYLPQLKSFCNGKMETEAFKESVAERKLGAPSSLFNARVSLPNLEDLQIDSIGCEKIWPDKLSEKTSNLTSLKVDSCTNLKYLFTTIMVKNLSQLKRLEIWRCGSMEEVILTDESAEKVEKIVFPKLNTMRLSYLRKLKRFCSGCQIEFQSLTELDIQYCDELMNFVSSGEANSDNSEMLSLFDGMVGLSNLEELNLQSMKNLRNVWANELLPNAFSRLKSLDISLCSKLVTVFPSNNLPRFRRLEKLKLGLCDSVQEVFRLQRLNDEEINDVVDFKLTNMSISSLDNLKSIWSEDPRSIFTFQQFQLVKVCRCNSLKYVFPASIGRGLSQLESLEIGDSGVEEIVGKGKEEESNPNFEFPQLTSLQLYQLRKMTSFYPGKHTVEWPKLKRLDVRGCNKTTPLGSNKQQAVASNAGETQHNIIIFLEKLNPNLEELTMSHKNFLRMRLEQCSVDCLSRLKVLKLHYLLNDHSHSLLLSFLKKLNNLRKLVVSQAYIEELFSDEASVRELQNLGTLARVKHLEIENSYYLKHIWKQENGPNPIISSTYVETLTIQSCHSLISIVHPSSSFQNLATLDVSYCQKLKSLTAVSTAKTMVQLMKLKISNCSIMTEVVESVAHHSVDEIIFSKLRILELKDLPHLTGFCLGSYAFNFPVLEEAIVCSCTRMEIFCLGVVNTPKLRAMRPYTYSHELFWQGNLNATIANLSMKRVHTGFQLSNYSDRLKRNWDTQHLGRGFHNVQHMTVDGCAFLTKALSVNHLQYLKTLRNLKVRGCESLQVVFDLEGTSSIQGHVDLLPCLTYLSLIGLPMLRDWWNKDPKGMLDLKKFKWLYIEDCSSLRHTFTYTTASCFENLQTVELKNCLMIEALMKKDEAEEEASYNIIFPSLTSVFFECLPNLSSLCEGSGNLECPALKKVSIYECPKVNEQLFSFKVMPILEELSLDSKSAKMILQSQLPLQFLSQVQVVELRFFPSISCFYLFAFLQRLPNLRKLSVNTSSLNELFLFTAGVQDSTIRSCGDVIHLGQSSLSFSNLTTLEVSQCNKLTSLIPLSVVKNLGQLVTLTISSCEMLTEVVRCEAGGVLDEITFSKMKNLQLYNLHCLKSFCSNSCSFEFTSLENVTVSNCPNFMLFCFGVLRTPKLHCVESIDLYGEPDSTLWEGDLNATIQKMHINMDGFRRLRKLELSKFPMLKAVWHGEFPFSSLSSLRKLVVDECTSFLYAIPSNLLQHLNVLKLLVVRKCDSLEEVFDLQDPTVDEADDVLIKSVEDLQLMDLPRLRHIWNKDPQGILSFRRLKLLKVQNCGSLTHIFTLSMALGLGNLQRFEVERCYLVEHIIVIGDEENVRDTTIFPSLESMSLECLPGLLSFYSANDVLKCPSLKKVDVVGCQRMNIFPSAFSLEQGLDMIVEAKEETLCNDILISPLFDGKIAIPSLEQLGLEWNTVKNIQQELFLVNFFCGLKSLKLKCCPGEIPTFPSDLHQKVPNLEIKLGFSDVHHPGLDVAEEKHFVSLPQLKVLISSPVSLQNLTALEVSKCRGLKNLVNATAARSLAQLKRLDIQECEMIHEIVVPEADEVDEGDEIEFSQLRFLRIYGLPSLTSFCSDNIALNFPLLEEVIVRECPNMKTFSKQVKTTPKLWKVQTGEEKYEWEWEGNLNDTIEASFMQLNVKQRT